MKRTINFGIVISIIFWSMISFTANAQDDSYIIKKGDVISIAVMGHPEFSLENVIVLPDGYIQFPGLGNIQASGMSVKLFTKLVTESVSKFVLNPIVTVFISALPSQIVNVIGYVNRPGQITIFEKISVMDAISRAGGIKFIDKCKRVIIIRANLTYEEVLVKDLFSSDKSKPIIKLLDIGDTVYVVEPKEVNWSRLSFFTSLGYIILSVIRLL